MRSSAANSSGGGGGDKFVDTRRFREQFSSNCLVTNFYRLSVKQAVRLDWVIQRVVVVVVVIVSIFIFDS